MKIHKVLTDSVSEACKAILEKGEHASYIIPQTLAKDKRYGARDRRFMAEYIIFILKNFRLLSFISNQAWGKPANFDSILAHALHIEQNEIPDFLTKFIDKDTIAAKLIEAEELIKINYSFPDWLDKLLEKDLGKEKWKLEAAASNQKPLTYLRINASKSDIDSCLKELKTAKIDCEKTNEIINCIQLNQRADIRGLEAYKKGFIEIQDAGSQLIGLFLDAKPNQRVIDACAGAGGKSLHLADAMKNLGKVVSMDVDMLKLDELKKRATRNNFTNIKVHLHQENTVDKYKNWADKVLLDVPCSGLGVLKRNPDDKWKLTEQRIKELIEIQAYILANYSKMLKIGGTLVYATCSIYSKENKDQVQKFLSENSNFEFVEDKQLYPSEGFDGFYMAKLTRTA